MASSLSGESQTVYEELVTFLQSDRLDVRTAAAEACLAVEDRQGVMNLIRHGVIASLCRISSRRDKAGLASLECLVKFSSFRGPSIALQTVEDMLDCGAVGRFVEMALSNPTELWQEEEEEEEEEKNHKSSCSKEEYQAQWRQRVNYAMALLANMTRTERGAVEFCGRSLPEEAVPTANRGDAAGEAAERLPEKPAMTLLLSRFLSPTFVTADGSTDGEDLLASLTPKQLSSDKNTLPMSAGGMVFSGGMEQEKHEEDDEIDLDADDDDDVDNERDGKFDDPYQHFAACLMNSTQTEQGRKFLMKLGGGTTDGPHPKSVLQLIVPQLRSWNVIRRRGVAGIVKNCCFDTHAAWWLIHGVQLPKHLMYPLAGPEALDEEDRTGLDPDLWMAGPDKLREADARTRLFLVESLLLLLASGRQSRETMRAQKVYVILKMADMVEEDEGVSERINECVQYLRRDEAGTEEGSADRKADSAAKVRAARMAAFGGHSQPPQLPAPSASGEVGRSGGAQDNLDDVD